MGDYTTNPGLRTSPAGRTAIEQGEGLSLTAYADQHGVWTIGYGSTTDVWPGLTITPEEADARFAIDLHHAESAIYSAVRISLSQTEFDALVSLVYNIGGPAFRTSHLCGEINSGDYGEDLGPLWLEWNHVAGQVNAGLTRRRAWEWKLWSEGIYPDPNPNPTSAKGVAR